MNFVVDLASVSQKDISYGPVSRMTSLLAWPQQHLKNIDGQRSIHCLFFWNTKLSLFTIPAQDMIAMGFANDVLLLAIGVSEMTSSTGASELPHALCRSTKCDLLGVT